MKKILVFALVTPVLICSCLVARRDMEEQPLRAVSPSTFASFEGLAAVDYATWEIGQPGGELVMSLTSDPTAFNPIVAAGTSSTSAIIDLVFDRLIDRDNLTLEWEGKLCAAWDIAGDGLSAVFTIRDGLKWSDGQPVSAEDVVFTVNELIYNPEIRSRHKDAFYVGDEPATVELLETMRFKVTLPRVYAGMLNMMSIPVLPKHIIEPFLERNGYAAFNSHWGVNADLSTIVGSGPFLIREYLPGRKIVLEKNPTYWRRDAAGNRLPYLDTITYLIVADQNAALSGFQAGDSHTYSMRAEDVAVLATRKQELDVELYNAGPTTGTTFLVFNQNYTTVEEPKRSWFNDKTFRKAMAHLIDREAIISDVHLGFGYPQYSFVPSASRHYLPEVRNLQPHYDPKAAIKLLERLGLSDRDGDGVREDQDGNKVAFVLQTNSSNSERVQIGRILAREAKAVGVEMTLQVSDFNSLVTALLETYEWDAMIMGLTGSTDPISGASIYPSRGRLHLTEPLQESPRRDWERGVDRWWGNAHLTLDETRRDEGYRELQRLWAEELPWIYISLGVQMYACSNRLGNVKPLPATGGMNGICEYLYFK